MNDGVAVLGHGCLLLLRLVGEIGDDAGEHAVTALAVGFVAPSLVATMVVNALIGEPHDRVDVDVKRRKAVSFWALHIG